MWALHMHIFGIQEEGITKVVHVVDKDSAIDLLQAVNLKPPKHKTSNFWRYTVIQHSYEV